MPNFLDEGRAFLRDAITDPDVGGVTLAAVRWTQDRSKYTCTITTAVVGKTVFASNATGGPRVEHGERDYLIPLADYKLGRGGAACEPEEGDQFTRTEGGEMVVWAIKPIPGEPAWRWSDGGRTLLRVHCKRVTNDEGR